MVERLDAAGTGASVTAVAPLRQRRFSPAICDGTILAPAMREKERVNNVAEVGNLGGRRSTRPLSCSLRRIAVYCSVCIADSEGMAATTAAVPVHETRPNPIRAFAEKHAD